MNAHNEQHVIEQIAQQWDGCMYDSVGETINIGEAIRAAGKRLSSQPAAAQEAVRQPDGYHYRYPNLYGTDTYIRKNNGEEVNGIKPVEAVPYWYAPVTAAPACLACEGRPAGTNIPCAVCKSTPAAPGIDHAAMIRSNLRSIRSMANSLPKSFALVSSNIGHEIDHAMTLLDASPKGALNEQFGSAEGLGSPNGGSEARQPSAWISDNDLLKLRDSIDEARNIRMSSERTHLRVHPVFIPAMKAQAGDAEVQP